MMRVVVWMNAGDELQFSGWLVCDYARLKMRVV